MRMIPYGPGQYLNADQIQTVADAGDGTPITVTLAAGAPIVIDPQARPGIAWYLRHALGYASMRITPPPILPAWNPSPPMPQ